MTLTWPVLGCDCVDELGLDRVHNEVCSSGDVMTISQDFDSRSTWNRLRTDNAQRDGNPKGTNSLVLRQTVETVDMEVL